MCQIKPYSFDWDANDIKEKIEWYLSQDTQRVEIAKNAQEVYHLYLSDKDSGQNFANHFNHLIEITSRPRELVF